MKMQLRLLAGIATLALAGLAFTGCGNDCATGTTEKDGECAVDTKACAPGTKLENAKCVLDTTGCGDGASLTGGVCVADDPTGEECGDATMFDSGTGKCIPVEIITCGDNTVKKDGSCVPAETVCTDGTMLNSDKQCVVSAPACSTGTQLDPNTGKCIVTESVCDANTAYDSTSNTCKPTATVCATGTTFEDGTKLCLPDATCVAGDMIVDGKCYSPDEALYKSTTVEGAENDDTDFGGTANAITLPAMSMTTTFKGTIGPPTDLDSDGADEQDLDMYKFAGTAGQRIKIDLKTIDGPSMGFLVTGPNDWIRVAPIALKRGSSREIILPWDGDYTIQISTAAFLLSESGPVGSDDWKYVAGIELLPAATATDIDTSNVNIIGDYTNLGDNLYKITNYSAGEIVDVTIKKNGKNVNGVVQLWSGPTSYINSFDMGDVDETFSMVLPTGDAFLLLDWVYINGPEVNYEIEVVAKPGQQALGELAPNGTASSTAQDVVKDEKRFFTFKVAAGEFIEITQLNVEQEDVRLKLLDPSGDVADSSSFFTSSDKTYPDVMYLYSPNGGSYIVEVEARKDITGLVVTTNSITPTDGGSFDSMGQSIVITEGNVVADERSKFYKVIFTEGVKLEGTIAVNGVGNVDFNILDENGEEQSSFDDDINIKNLNAGTYYFQFDVTTELDQGFTLSLVTGAPPAPEVEPNNDTMTATPITIPGELIGTGGHGANKEFSAADVPFDYFSFTLAQDQTSGQAIQFMLSPIALSDATGNLYFLIFDSMGNEIGKSNKNGNNQSFIFDGMATGTYYIGVAVSSVTDRDTQYLLSSEYLAFEIEPNDDKTTATPITMLPAKFAGNANEAKVGDQDYWSYTPAQDEDITFSCSTKTISGNPYIRAWLYDSMDVELAKKYGRTTSFNASLTANTTYMFKIGGDSTRYDKDFLYECELAIATN